MGVGCSQELIELLARKLNYSIERLSIISRIAYSGEPKDENHSGSYC